MSGSTIAIPLLLEYSSQVIFLTTLSTRILSRVILGEQCNLPLITDLSTPA